MNTIIYKYRFLLLRRIVQLCLIVLFVGGNYFGWTLLRGNYSSAMLLDRIPLTDPYALLQIISTGFISTVDLAVGGVIVLGIYGLITGRMFCSWVCPVNIITDTAIFSRKKLKIEPGLKLSRNLRYGVLVLGLILSAILGIAAFEAISPIAMLHRGIIFGFGVGWAVLLALFLFDLAVSKNGWCGHLCPLGAFYTLAGRYAILKVKHKKEKCTNCMKCFKVCPEEPVLDIIGVKSGFIKSSACTNCARCIEVCDDKALSFSLSNSLKKQD